MTLFMPAMAQLPKKFAFRLHPFRKNGHPGGLTRQMLKKRSPGAGTTPGSA
jgi:hypothetical protein